MRAEPNHTYEELYKKIDSLVPVDLLKYPDIVPFESNKKDKLLEIEVSYHSKDQTSLFLTYGDDYIGVKVDKVNKQAQAACRNREDVFFDDGSENKGLGIEVNAQLNSWLKEAKQFGYKPINMDKAPVATLRSTT